MILETTVWRKTAARALEVSTLTDLGSVTKIASPKLDRSFNQIRDRTTEGSEKICHPLACVVQPCSLRALDRHKRVRPRCP